MAYKFFIDKNLYLRLHIVITNYANIEHCSVIPNFYREFFYFFRINMQQSVKERLIEFLKHEKISQRAFEISVGLSNGYVNNIRVSIQPNTIQKIVLKYPHINEGWLLTGNGPMLKTNITNNNQLNTEGMTIEDELRELKNRLRFLEDQVSFNAREHREIVRRDEMEGFFVRNGSNLNKQTIA